MTKSGQTKSTFAGCEVISLPIVSLRPYLKNPRKNDSAVDAVANSIREFGFRQPIVVDTNMVVIVGHTRLKAAKKLGMDEVPVIIADMTEEQARAYRLVDNKTNELSEWDMEALRLEIDGLEADLAAFGFDLEADLKQFDVNGIEAPELPDGDRAPFRQVTFTLHDDQYGRLEEAMHLAKKQGGGTSSINENSNGNALAFICEVFLGRG